MIPQTAVVRSAMPLDRRHAGQYVPRFPQFDSPLMPHMRFLSRVSSHEEGMRACSRAIFFAS